MTATEIVKNYLMKEPFRGVTMNRILIYAGPCMGVWSLFFLAYFPGMMSQDSLDQWVQVIKFEFDDWHPAFLTILYWLLSRIWFSPAVVCLFQILALALVFAYGMIKLEKIGAPVWSLVLITLFFSLFPLNGFYVNTLFKDVPYGIAFLLIFIYSILILETKGQWLYPVRNLFLFALTLSFVLVIRHNGILAVLAVVGSLGFFYSRHLKKIGILVALIASVVVFIKVPVYRAFNVTGRFYGVEILLTHQIAAAIHHGAELKPEETEFLAQVLPMSCWKACYNPYNSDDLVFNKDFNYLLLDTDLGKSRFRSTWFAIVSRNIPILLKHQYQVSDLVWNVGQQPGSYTYAVHPVLDANDMGLAFNSKLPSLQKIFTKFYYYSVHSSRLGPLLYRPALYFYAIVLMTLLVAWRLKRISLIFLIAPLVINTLGVLLTIPAQHVRYLYPNFVIAPFVFGYLVVLLNISLKNEKTNARVLETSR